MQRNRGKGKTMAQLRASYRPKARPATYGKSAYTNYGGSVYNKGKGYSVYRYGKCRVPKATIRVYRSRTGKYTFGNPGKGQKRCPFGTKLGRRIHRYGYS